MPVFSGTPTPFSRMLGQVDQDDPTNLPPGCAAVCRNTDFTRDAGGIVPWTRAGNCMIMQGAKSPTTGLWDFQYQPESATDPFFQMPLRFSLAGLLEREFPVGTGRMIPVPAGMFALPAQSHKIDCQAGNGVLSAYSNLKTPTAGLSWFNPKTLNNDPLGMKPYGWQWLPATLMYVNEVGTPSNQSAGPQGNGHTYQWLGQGGAIENVTIVHTQVGGAGPFFYVLAVKMSAWAFPAGTNVTFSGLSVYPAMTVNPALNGTTQATVAYNPLWGGVPNTPNTAYFLFGTAAYGSAADTGLGLVAGAGTGTTGAAEPAWPVTENAYVQDGTGVWQEHTMVIANRLPAPPAPVLTLQNAGGTFAAARTVYVVLTLTNAMGETIAGAVASITTTAADQGVQVAIPSLAALPGWLAELVAPYAITGVNVYETDETSGSAAPPLSRYLEAATDLPLGGSYTITASATGPDAPPTLNSARITPGQLYTPDTEPTITLVPGGGTFPAGRDVYVAMAYANAQGSTPIGPANVIVDTLLDDAVQVTLTQPDDLPQLDAIFVYEADVPTGSAPPPASAYCLVGNFSPTATLTITTTATGANPPTVNGTGPGGNIAADTTDGGINGTQGYRYAVPGWINRNETFSGFTQSAVSQYIVDEDGWEIAVFKVPLGPANIIGRTINWTVADGTSAGPWAWIGLVDLQIPTQNIVYPNSFPSDGISITPTVFLDNVTTSGTFNFTDDYLIGAESEAGNNSTDRLRVVAPPMGVRVDYLTTCDRIAISGVPGLAGPWVSLGADYESFYGDTSPVPVPTVRGETLWGCCEFRNQIYLMRSQSGLVMVPGTGDPASWEVRQRWGPTPDSEGTGPCGPRAFAACAAFIVFVHRTGVYKFDGTGQPDLMTKEIPRMWGSINWAAAQTIAVWIDVDTHTVRIQAPTGNSPIPNQEFCLSYLEGWLNPIHYSSYKTTEITQEAARRWSFNDVSAFLCRRIQRQVPNPPPPPLGPDGTVQLGTDFNISQLAYGSAIADGLVNARTPGRYDDNGAGIDWIYQGVSAQAMQKPSKPEGVVTSCVGFGDCQVGFLAGRRKLTDPGGRQKTLWCLPMALSPQGNVDFTRKPARAIDEYWSVVYTNGKVPGAWASIKKNITYVIPVKVARGTLDSGR